MPAVVSLSAVAHEMDVLSEEHTAYINRKTGELITLPDEDVRLVENDEPLDDLTIETFARDLGCSARQVSRLFREELGTTFRDHLVELRLARAKDLLERTPLNVIDVAGATGWSSLAHFNAVFRRHVGATPTGYRARFRAESGA